MKVGESFRHCVLPEDIEESRRKYTAFANSNRCSEKVTTLVVENKKDIPARVIIQ